MFPLPPLAAAILVVAATAIVPAMAQPAPPGTAPVSTSNYSDGTGDSAIDSLNASQLDSNYRGPRYEVRPGTVQSIDGAPPPPAAAPYPVPPYPATRPAYPVARPVPPTVRPPAPPPMAPPPAAPSAIYPAGPPN